MTEHADDTVIAALIDADTTTDAAAAERYGVSRKTISEWRGRVSADPRLSKRLREERRHVHGWIVETESLDIELSRAMKAKAQAGEDIPFSLIAAKKATSSALIQAGAMLGDSSSDDDEE